MSSTLIAHCGARIVSREELATVLAPESTRTWFPIPHIQVLDRVESSLKECGFEIDRTELALARQDNRFFGVLDLTARLVPGVRLSVGVRNSTDQSLPIGFVAGHRVTVCDNLAFSSEVKVVRKHTRFGEHRFHEALAIAVQGLTQYQAAETARIERFQNAEVNELDGDGLLLRLWENDVITSPTMLRHAVQQWRKSDYEEFQARNLWSLFNSVTFALADRQKTNPGQFAALTLRLTDILGQVAGPSTGASPHANAA